MHISDDLYIEICDPITGEPLPVGSIGEVVVTDFGNECYPLVRYGTGDLSALDDEDLRLREDLVQAQGHHGQGG